jgi:hypothetical protein
MPEQFDPARHRVFAVDVTCRYRTYVVAEDADQADDVAAMHEDDDREWADDVDRVVSVLEGPLPDAEERTLPWGPIGWGRRELTVSEALDLVRNPRPAPVPTPTDELRSLGDWDWIRLAAHGAVTKPDLRAVRVSGGRAVATDGHRLHVADAPCPEGLWDGDTMEPVSGRYPEFDWEHRWPAAPSLELVDLPAAWEVLRRARPGPVSLPGPAGVILLSADLLAEALLGGAAAGQVLLTVRGPHDAVRVDFPDLRRTAIVMPLRGGTGPDLGSCLRALPEVAVR